MSDDNGTTGPAGFDIDATDLGDLEERGATVHIKNEMGDEMFDSDGQPVTMTGKGSMSRTFRRMAHEARNRFVKRGLGRSYSSEQQEKDEVAIHAACITSWTGFHASGQPAPLSREAVLKVFTKFPHVFQQMKEEMDKRENFTERSSASSATP